MARSSVEGLDEFRRHMADLEGSYAVIGGAACDILLSDADLPFRATHDLDTVLVADARLPQTARAIWSLVLDGEYRCGWGGEENVCFYRFTDPKQPGYPSMIELFSKEPDFLRGSGYPGDAEVAPLHIDDGVSSLSAILLDDEYYNLMLSGIKTVDGISVLGEAHIIPFKAKAYLDLRDRRSAGQLVDSKKVKKHLRDALRLSQLLSGNERVPLPETIKNDMRAFLADCRQTQIDLKQIGVRGATMVEITRTLENVFGTSSTSPPVASNRDERVR